jgi:hypothetical protein
MRSASQTASVLLVVPKSSPIPIMMLPCEVFPCVCLSGLP